LRASARGADLPADWRVSAAPLTVPAGPDYSGGAVASVADGSDMTRRPKLLLIGLDGVRADTMARVARRPDSAIGRLMASGAWSFRTRTTRAAISGPAWSSVLTGVWAEKHGVVNNDLDPNNLDSFPHFLQRLGNRRTASIVGWAPLNERLIGAGRADVMEAYASDQRVCERVVALLERDADVEAVFVQLDEVDVWGHRAGYGSWSPFYYRAVVRADRMVGAMVETLAARRGAGEEDWLVVVTSDHGGRWFSHGADDEPNRRVPLVVFGARARRGPLAGEPGVVDVAVTSLCHLGVEVCPEWGMDGVVRGYARDPGPDA
jgi:hypothetical protein